MKPLPAWCKNKYVFTALIFGAWMLFFDHDDLITQWRLSRQIRELERKKSFYEQQIQQAEQQKAVLQHDPGSYYNSLAHIIILSHHRPICIM